MPNMPDVTKRQIGLRLPIKLCVAIEKMFSLPNDKTRAIAYIRALEECSRNVDLSPDDYRKIADEIEQNKKKWGKS